MTTMMVLITDTFISQNSDTDGEKTAKEIT